MAVVDVTGAAVARRGVVRDVVIVMLAAAVVVVGIFVRRTVVQLLHL